MSSTPVPYFIRVSARARYLRLRVTLEKGLEVVVPRGYDQRRIPQILSTNQSWVATALRRVEAARRAKELEDAATVPSQITLPSIGQTWHVETVSTKARSISVLEPAPDRLVLRGCVDNIPVCEAALQRWLLRKAHDVLTPWLVSISRETGIPYGKMALRKQKTRWGSCSTSGTISLNVKLLFVDPDLVRYILVHELCHVRHMDHSRKFWKLVSTFYEPYKLAHRRLEAAWRAMPSWVD